MWMRIIASCADLFLQIPFIAKRILVQQVSYGVHHTGIIVLAWSWKMKHSSGWDSSHISVSQVTGIERRSMQVKPPIHFVSVWSEIQSPAICLQAVERAPILEVLCRLGYWIVLDVFGDVGTRHLVTRRPPWCHFICELISATETLMCSNNSDMKKRVAHIRCEHKGEWHQI